MAPPFKAVTLGFLTGLLGLLVSLTPFGFSLEEGVGLDLLFRLRGARQAPAEVVVVTVGKQCAVHLNLPPDPTKWPRSLHARLVENLVKAGAAVIVFDMNFNEARSPEQDRLFADAIRRAGNVILFEYLSREIVPLMGKERPPMGNLYIEKLITPIPPLAESAIALAPFPLPKVPFKVSRYWAFKTGAGDTPTLPIVAFQTFALEVYDEFIQLLKTVNPSQAEKLPRTREAVLSARGVEKLVRDLRHAFESDPRLVEGLLEALPNSRAPALEDRKSRLLKSLIKMYQSADSPYLNFYGPPRSITTIPYYQVVQLEEKPVANPQQLDLKGKVVFVGFSENLRPEQQRDGFYTVFSQPDGLDVSGVEIATTAFANLLEDTPIQPLGLPGYMAVIFLWGAVLGIFCRLFSVPVGTSSVMGLSALYLVGVYYLFKTTGSWYPVIPPLFFQAPAALFGAILWKYFDTSKERQNIQKVFQYYLPSKIVDQLSKNFASAQITDQLVYGVCLATDAEQYTPLAESMDPKELGRFMNEYYEAVFEPVLQRGGIVSDVIGDSMFAIWATAHPDLAVKEQACLAALGIANSVHRFNQLSPTWQLPTRIGLHFGHILLGNVGAMNRYEYRAVGDVVNTAARLQGLNKHLGTQILVSQEVLDQLEGFLARELGKFLLVGKSKPLRVYELMGRLETSDELQRSRCAIFAEALDRFRRQSWEEAIEKFHEILKNHGEDGPSLFYLKLCEQHRENPPGASWQGVVHMGKK